MITLNKIGKFVFALGVLSLFRTDDSHYSCFGYVDHTWEIIVVGLVGISIGAALIAISKIQKGKHKANY